MSLVFDFLSQYFRIQEQWIQIETQANFSVYWIKIRIEILYTMQGIVYL